METEPKVKMGRIKIIKTFFETDGGRRVFMDEFKALTRVERAEMAVLCAVEMGVEVTE